MATDGLPPVGTPRAERTRPPGQADEALRQEMDRRSSPTRGSVPADAAVPSSARLRRQAPGNDNAPSGAGDSPTAEAQPPRRRDRKSDGAGAPGRHRRRQLRRSVPARYRSAQSRARAAAGCAVCYRHGTEVRSRASAPPPVVRFGTATVPKCAVAPPRRRRLCGLLPPRYRSAQSRARAAASCAVCYRHGTEVRSRAPAPPPIVRFGTATVPKCAVARPRRRRLCGLVPPRYRSAQSRARAAASCAVWYRHGTEVRSRAPGPRLIVELTTPRSQIPKEEILEANPLAITTVKGVGKLVEIGTALGRVRRTERAGRVTSGSPCRRHALTFPPPDTPLDEHPRPAARADQY
jgi:hypothetical protein